MREIEESIESTIDRSWIEIRINKKKIEISPHSAKFSTAIFQRTRLPWEINLCNLDVSSYIVVRDATCTPRRQFFWRTLSYAFARRGETEDMRRAVDLLPVRSIEAIGTRQEKGKISPRLLYQSIFQKLYSFAPRWGEKFDEAKLSIRIVLKATRNSS